MRVKALDAFHKDDSVRGIVSCGMLDEGFDPACVDWVRRSAHMCRGSVRGFTCMAIAAISSYPKRHSSCMQGPPCRSCMQGPPCRSCMQGSPCRSCMIGEIQQVAT